MKRELEHLVYNAENGGFQNNDTIEMDSASPLKVVFNAYDTVAEHALSRSVQGTSFKSAE
eukprot:2458275-Amphidinium_carterae.1